MTSGSSGLKMVTNWITWKTTFHWFLLEWAVAYMSKRWPFSTANEDKGGGWAPASWLKWEEYKVLGKGKGPDQPFRQCLYCRKDFFVFFAAYFVVSYRSNGKFSCVMIWLLLFFPCQRQCCCPQINPGVSAFVEIPFEFRPSKILWLVNLPFP